jgi:hypothetical protein
MDFVTIGNPGNPPNPQNQSSSTAGSVGYTFEIGTYEVSRDTITKFNASQSLQISLGDMTDLGGNTPQKPATGMTIVEAAKFVNWLNTSSGYQAAYQFSTGANENALSWIGNSGYDQANPYRNKFSKYALTSRDEWHKAAFYDPNKGISGGYWLYPNASDTAPNPVTGGTAPNTAVYSQAITQGPANVNDAGGLSAYGVMGLAGNVWEWQEFGGLGGSRSMAGGNWIGDKDQFQNRFYFILGGTQLTARSLGFRVVSLASSAAPVPEPSMMVMATLLGLGGYIGKRRMKK